MRIPKQEWWLRIILLAALFLAVALPTHAWKIGRKDHCPHTPENPSIVLFLAGSAAIGYRYLRARLF